MILIPTSKSTLLAWFPHRGPVSKSPLSMLAWEPVGLDILRRSVVDLNYYRGKRGDGRERPGARKSGGGWRMWLWYRRHCGSVGGIWEVSPHAVTSLDGRWGQRVFFRVCAPRLPPNKSTINEKQNPPPSPSSLRLCSTARPGGDTLFRERRERWRGGRIIGRREGKKTATEVTWTKAASLRGVMSSDVCKRGVDLHIFPQIRYIFFSSVFH